MKSILKSAALNAIATAVYVALIASFLFYAGEAGLGRSRTALIPVAMLLLFVMSAAITGVLMFGQPTLWYFDGKKKEALSLLTATLAIFMAITLLALLVPLFGSV